MHMIFEDMDPIELYFVHDTINENQIFFWKYGMIAAPRSEHPGDDEGNEPLIQL